MYGFFKPNGAGQLTTCLCKCKDISCDIEGIKHDQRVSREAIQSLTDAVGQIAEIIACSQESVKGKTSKNTTIQAVGKQSLHESFQELNMLEFDEHNSIETIEIIEAINTPKVNNISSRINLNPQLRNTIESNKIAEVSNSVTLTAQDIPAVQINTKLNTQLKNLMNITPAENTQGNTPISSNTSDDSVAQANTNSRTQLRNPTDISSTPKHLVPCPFLRRNGHCLKGSKCDFSISLVPSELASPTNFIMFQLVLAIKYHLLCLFSRL